MSKTWDYARCCTNEDKQDITRQIRELKSVGAEEVIFEYARGDAKAKKTCSYCCKAQKPGIPSSHWRSAV